MSHRLTSLYKSKDDKRRIFDCIIVVTDRTNLDDQLRGTVKSISKVDGVVFGAEKGSKELREFLEKGKDIIITTIQKFPDISEDIVALGDKKFAVIIDEVHSSQNGELSKELKRTLTRNEDDEEEDFTLESYLEEQIQTRGRQKHISFFGFTGTPKEKTLEILADAKTDVSNFFDNVIVNDEDEAVKKNRLELMQLLCKTFNNYLNFSDIESA